MKKWVLFCVFVLVVSVSYSQQGLLFSNAGSGAEVLVKERDLVKVSYSGYLGQKEVVSGMVVSIRDSVVELQRPSRSGVIDTKFVLVKDITGFRKFHKSRTALMLVSRLGAAVGSIVLYYYIDKNTNLTFAENLGVSIGTGLVTTGVIKVLFPERIRNVVGEGAWSVEVLK